MNDAERLRTYLTGWDEGVACLLDSLSWVPAHQLAEVVTGMIARREEPS